MKTKIALMTADGVSASALNVDTVNGMVTLHGKVPVEAEKVKAEDIARRIDGVKGVKNLEAIEVADAVKGVRRVSTEVQVDESSN